MKNFISQSDISSYQQTALSYNIERWIDELKDVTFPTGSPSSVHCPSPSTAFTFASRLLTFDALSLHCAAGFLELTPADAQVLMNAFAILHPDQVTPSSDADADAAATDAKAAPNEKQAGAAAAPSAAAVASSADAKGSAPASLKSLPQGMDAQT